MLLPKENHFRYQANRYLWKHADPAAVENYVKTRPDDLVVALVRSPLSQVVMVFLKSEIDRDLCS